MRMIALMFILFFMGSLAAAMVGLYFGGPNMTASHADWREKRLALLRPFAVVAASFFGAMALPFLLILNVFKVEDYFPCSNDGCMAVGLILMITTASALVISMLLNSFVVLRSTDRTLRKWLLVSFGALIFFFFSVVFYLG